MPAFNFQPQWANAVEIGAYAASGIAVGSNSAFVTKRSTIRKAGRAVPGQTLHLFVGQRTKSCRKLGEVLCLGVTPIERVQHGLLLQDQLITGDRLEQFARMDTAGFWSAAELLVYLDKTYPPDQVLALYIW